MASNTIRVRASKSGDVTTVKALINHPMETGLRKNKKTGKKIPAHYIQEVTCEHNGSNVVVAQWGPAVSKNPYLSFQFSGANSGDKITLSWVDNQGDKDSTTASIG